jgi:C4-type Zn-finger protein
VSETEPKHLNPQPEDTLTPEEADLLQQAERGELTCLTCGEPLTAERVVSPYYEGVVLFCPDMACGYRAVQFYLRQRKMDRIYKINRIK